jgi:hypothetical protein
MAAKPVLKTGRDTGRVPPPASFIAYLQRSAQPYEMAKGMKGYPAKARPSQDGIERDAQEPIAAYPACPPNSGKQILLGDRALQLPTLQIGNEQGRN